MSLFGPNMTFLQNDKSYWTSDGGKTDAGILTCFYTWSIQISNGIFSSQKHSSNFLDLKLFSPTIMGERKKGEVDVEKKVICWGEGEGGGRGGGWFFTRSSNQYIS